AMSPFRLWINYVEVALSVTVFVSAMMTIRWCSQWQRASTEISADRIVEESGENK
ncbi:MAG: putative membrane protein, partial [Bacteroidia bacterium]